MKQQTTTIPKLTIHLVTWNGEQYIPFLFDALKKQTFQDFKLYILDNASTDATVSHIKNELNGASFEYEIVEKTENTGFAPGHNELYQKSDSEYFLLLNQDMYLHKNVLEQMVHFLDEHPESTAISPRLMRWDFEKTNTGIQQGLTADVDALGLKVFRNRRVIEAFTKHNWNDLSKKFDTAFIEVFGVSGAFPMFRRSDIEKIQFDDNTFFDESHHSYKEDVDLAFRLRSAGYKSHVLLDALSYHDRSGAGPKKMSDTSAFANKQKQSTWIKYHSYKNQHKVLLKNEYWQNFILDMPWILWYEIKKFIYFFLFEPSMLKGIVEIYKDRKDVAKKRKYIAAKRAITWKELRKWWT